MAVQGRADLDNTPLILSDSSDVENCTIVQDEARTTNILDGTVMAQIAATGSWTPFVSVAGVDGSGVPRGIYHGADILAADIVDDDVENVPIIVGNARVNTDLVVWDDDTLDAETVVAPGTVNAMTARRALFETANIRMEETVQTTDHEN